MRPLLLPLLAALASAQVHEVTASRIAAHTRFLSSDLLEGRGVGARGGDLATEYLAAQLALLGVQPAGDDGTYFQRVPLVGVTTQPSATLTAVGRGKPLALQWQEEFVGTTQRQRTDEQFEAEAVFVGHGITAPEFDWDDYKGADVRGKVVLLFTNEPPSADEKLFGGKALTYYGRWTYKYEEALRRGALGCLILHTTPTAGYGFEVVRNSWGKEDPQVALAPGGQALAVSGWLTEQAGRKVLEAAGKDFTELLEAADTRGFKPVPLNLRFRASLPAKIRPIESRNVVGVLRGSDPERAGEAVLYSAHWDHLGISVPVDGDAIYNGAIDNATGCAVVLEIARAWASLSQRPRRSAVFLFVTAEENGLRGSEYYGLHPVIPPQKSALNINYDALYPFGLTKDVIVSGAERTTAWPMVQEAARRFSLEIKPDPRPEQGLMYRSDHFSLARRGIPAFSVKMGNEFLGKGEGFGTQMFRDYNSRRYHQPDDEFMDNWDFAGLEQMGRFGLVLGLNVANADLLPRWRPGDEFARP